MTERLSFQDVHGRLLSAIEALDQLNREAFPRTDAPATGPLYEGLSAVLLAASTSLGECRRAEPFSPLHPVLDDSGLSWCCNHDPEHCGR
jgi:hypothetical protein